MKKYQNLDDQTLVSLFVNESDERAFSALMKKYSEKLKAIISKITNNNCYLEDILQDTWTKVSISLRNGSYKSRGRFVPWLTVITRNESISFLRDIKKKSINGTLAIDMMYGDVLNVMAKISKTPEEIMIGIEIDYQIQSEINLLPEKQRKIILFLSEYELSYKDIESLTGTPRSTLRSCARKARMNLAMALKAYA